METLHTLLDFLLHLNQYLDTWVREYQTTTYLILCLIIFCETGLVATPILPGDSLLFAAGIQAAKTPDIINVWILIPLLIASAIIGDNVNYLVGNKLGLKVFEKFKFLKKEYLVKTEEFYAKHGGKTIIMARFVPIVRTFAPFVAGLGAMNYRKYISYCLAGGSLWVTLLTLAGYFFGNFDIVKNNFEIVIFAIIGISLLPVVIQFVKVKLSK